MEKPSFSSPSFLGSPPLPLLTVESTELVIEKQKLNATIKTNTIVRKGASTKKMQKPKLVTKKATLNATRRIVQKQRKRQKLVIVKTNMIAKKSAKKNKKFTTTSNLGPLSPDPHSQDEAPYLRQKLLFRL